MESFATDMRPSDSGVNRVLKMFTGATVSDNLGIAKKKLSKSQFCTN